MRAGGRFSAWAATCERLRDLQAQAERLERFSERIHARLDLKSTAYAIANEGRVAVDCDRLSVVQVQGSHCRVILRQRRGPFGAAVPYDVRLLDGWCRRSWRPVIRSGTATSRPAPRPQIDAPLHAYLDRAHSRLLVVLPISESSRSPARAVAPRSSPCWCLNDSLPDGSTTPGDGMRRSWLA